MPGAYGNMNNWRHGLRSSQLPRDCRHVEHSINRLRMECEDAVAEIEGGVPLHKAALIQSCMRHERRALLLERWLRVANGDLSTMDRVHLLSQVSAATDARDKCIEKLGIDRDVAGDLPQWLYQRPSAEHEASAGPDGESSTESESDSGDEQ